MSEHLTIDRQGTVTVLTLDDGKVNALSADLIASISRAVSEAESDKSTTAIVLVGRPGKFSAGFDLGVMRGGDPAAVVNLVTDGGELVHQLYSCSVPVISACTGHALAAGALILLGCDIRIGAAGPYKIGLNETAIGMVLPPWAVTIAQDRLTPTHIQRALPTAHITDAQGAKEAGFLDEVVAESADLLATAMDHAATCAGLSRRAYAGTSALLRTATLDTMRSQLDAERASVA